MLLRDPLIEVFWPIFPNGDQNFRMESWDENRKSTRSLVPAFIFSKWWIEIILNRVVFQQLITQS